MCLKLQSYWNHPNFSTISLKLVYPNEILSLGHAFHLFVLFFYWIIVDYKVVIVSGIQQSDSDVCKYRHGSIFFFRFFPHIGHYTELSRIPCTLHWVLLKPLVAQSCPALCNPMDCSLPHSSVHGILQARILEWVAIHFSKGSSWPRDRTQVSHTAVSFFTVWAIRGARSSLAIYFVYASVYMSILIS